MLNQLQFKIAFTSEDSKIRFWFSQRCNSKYSDIARCDREIQKRMRKLEEKKDEVFLALLQKFLTKKDEKEKNQSIYSQHYDYNNRLVHGDIDDSANRNWSDWVAKHFVTDTDVDIDNAQPVIPKGVSEGNKRLLGREILDPSHLPSAMPLSKRIKLVQPAQPKTSSKTDRKKFRERIKTYSESEWQELPDEVSPNYLSRFGWVYNDDNIICQNCDNRLRITTGSIEEQSKMMSGHSEKCSSRDYRLPYSVLFMQISKAQQIIAEIKKLMRCKSKRTECEAPVSLKINQKESPWCSNYLKLILCGWNNIQCQECFKNLPADNISPLNCHSKWCPWVFQGLQGNVVPSWKKQINILYEAMDIELDEERLSLLSSSLTANQIETRCLKLVCLLYYWLTYFN
jgi:hypothetical protein